VELVRIGELARRSRVPVATIKFYVRAGLIAPARKTGQTMSWYSPKVVERLKAIKELQERQFLPLDVIKQALDRDEEAPDELAAAEAIAGVLAKRGGRRSRTRDEVLARGASAIELQWLATAGLAVPGADGAYRGDDLALLSTLGAARRAGIRADMLPFDIMQAYLMALHALVEVELRLFRDGVIRKADRRDVARLTTAATKLSERLVVIVRRKLLLPTLRQLIEEELDVEDRTLRKPADRVRGQHQRSRPRRRAR
jgi:DNA-binding transcriptional MerR regulator